MRLTDEQQAMLQGDAGPALEWAMQFNYSLGCFFDAEHMLPIASAHFAPDTRIGGAAGQRLLEEMERLLRPGGYLLVGHAETLTGMMSPLKTVRPSIYVKDCGAGGR